MAITSVQTELLHTSHDNGTPALIEQEKLAPELANYMRYLAHQPEQVKDIRVERHRIEQDLAPQWFATPPEWMQAAQEIRAIISNHIQSLPTVGTTSALLIRLSLGASHLLPPALHNPDESVSFLAFDATEGVLRTCLAKTNEKLPTIGDIAVSSGLIVTGQPLAPLTNPYGDDNPYVQKTGDNLYDRRNNDKLLGGGAQIDPPYVEPLIPWQIYAKGLRPGPLRNYTQGELVARLQEDVAAFMVLRQLAANNERYISLPVSTATRAGTSATGAANTPAANNDIPPPQPERRADEFHDRRGEGRPEHYVPGATYIDGHRVMRYEGHIVAAPDNILPPATEAVPDAAQPQQAHIPAAELGREVASAENEVTAILPAAAATAGILAAPQRPEEGVGSPELQAIQLPAGAPQQGQTSPFAPPIAAVVAAEAEQALAVQAAQSAPESLPTAQAAATPALAEQVKTAGQAIANAAQQQAVSALPLNAQAAAENTTTEENNTLQNDLNYADRRYDRYDRANPRETRAGIEREDNLERERRQQEDLRRTREYRRYNDEERRRYAENDRLNDELRARLSEQNRLREEPGNNRVLAPTAYRQDYYRGSSTIESSRGYDSELGSDGQDEIAHDIFHEAGQEKYQTFGPIDQEQNDFLHKAADAIREAINNLNDQHSHLEDRYFASWDKIRDSFSNLSDASLALLAALGSPTARNAYQMRVQRKQAAATDEATAEERDELKQELEAEKLRERAEKEDQKQEHHHDVEPHHDSHLDDLTPGI